MFLTTESSLVGKNYNALQIIHATSVSRDIRWFNRGAADEWDTVIGDALRNLYSYGMYLGADGVIGVSLSTSAEQTNRIIATVMGTAIKFY